MTDEGLMCVGGRLKNATLQAQIKHPIILPQKHHVVTLLVRHFHAISGHSGREHVMSLMRQRYWVVRGRTTVRQVLHDCFECKHLSASPNIQKMADLPEDRVSPEKPPFSMWELTVLAHLWSNKAEVKLKDTGVSSHAW